jgi:hypothetical protein
MGVKVVKNPLLKNVATAAALVGFVGGVYVYTYSKMKTVRSSTALRLRRSRRAPVLNFLSCRGLINAQPCRTRLWMWPRSWKSTAKAGS